MQRKKIYTIAAISLAIMIILPIMVDLDSDGLSTWIELTSHTNPLKKDTDDDGLDDGTELKLGANQLLNDTDGDGLADGAEVNTYGTNPLVGDTDHDGVNDFQEISIGTDPLNADSDHDGLYDCESFPLDPAQPILNLSLTDINIERSNWIPFIAIQYDVIAEDGPINRSWICDSKLMTDRLDWSKLRIFINGNENANYTLGFLTVRCNLPLNDETNVTVLNDNEILNKTFKATNTNYTSTEITDYWNHTSIPQEYEQDNPRTSMQKTFDEFAKLISGFIFMNHDISSLKSRFSSTAEWNKWLDYVVHNAGSAKDALSCLRQYANASGIEDLVQNVWIEIQAVARTLGEFHYIAVNFPDLIERAVRRYISGYDVWQYLELMEELQDISSTSYIFKAISAATTVMQWTYVELGQEYFGWVENNTSGYISDYAAGAKWYLANLERIRSVHSFGQIIDTKYQFIHTGEEGVAWWPAKYSFYTTYWNTPYSSTDPIVSTEFPVTEVQWISYGIWKNQTETYYLYLATESIVMNHLEKNGFNISHMPPTNQQKEEVQMMRLIAKFADREFNRISTLFMFDNNLRSEILKLCNAFSDYDSASESLGIMKKYRSSQSFLNFVNEKLWLIEQL